MLNTRLDFQKQPRQFKVGRDEENRGKLGGDETNLLTLELIKISKTRRCGTSSSSCGGLWPSTEAFFFALREKSIFLCLFWPKFW